MSRQLYYHIVKWGILFYLLFCVKHNDFNAQINYSTDFSSTTDWTGSGFGTTTTDPCSGTSLRENVWSSLAEGDLHRSSSFGTSLGGEMTVTFDYKVIDYSGGGATPSSSFGMVVQSATSASGPWTTEYTVVHTASTSCATKSFTYTPPAGNTVFLKFRTDWSSGDFWVYYDDLSVVESLCTAPSATYAVSPDCGNSQFYIDVNVSSLGDGTAVDISNDGGVAASTNVSTGTTQIGPFTYANDVIVTVDGSAYSGCAASPSSTLTETCSCATPPTATVSSTNLNCGTSTYDIEVTVNNDGSGDVNKTDIKIDGSVVQADATQSNLYTFPVSVGSHTVTLEGEGAGFVTCTSSDYNENLSCNNDECIDAFGITVDGAAVTSLIPSSDYTTSSGAPACPTYGWSSQVDSWYSFVAPSSNMAQIDLTDNLSGSGDAIYYEFELYSGSCGSLASVACSKDNNLNGYVLTGLTSGNTYYLRVWNKWGSSAGTYDLKVINPLSTLTAGVQTCADMTIATNLSQDVCSFANPIYDDDIERVYTFTPSFTSNYDFTVTGLTDDDVGIMITDGLTTSDNCLGSDFDASVIRDLSATNVSLTGSTTYYIIIVGDGTSYGSVSGQACITISAQCGSTYTTSVVTNDCSSGTYTGRINFSNLGGAAVTYNLSDDDGNSFSSISTGNYDFSYTDISAHMVTLKGYDGGSNLVCEEDIRLTAGCISNICSDAIDILGSTIPVDMTNATNDNSETDYGGEPDYESCGNGTTIGNCDNSIYHSAYTETNYNDLWFVVDIPDGTDEFTVTLSNFSGSGYVYVLPYSSSGSCASLTLMDIGNPGILGGNCPSFNGDGSLTYQGTDVSTASTNPIYLRIIPHENSVSSSATDACSNQIQYPTFDISASSPQPNDIDDNAIEIDATSSTGNLCLANIESESTETGDACAESQDTKDLWYKVSAGASDPNAKAKISVTFPNASDAVVITEYYGAISNAYQECVTLSSTGVNSTVSHTFSDEIPASGSNYYRVTPSSSNGICSYTIAGERVLENDNCSHFTNTLPGYNLHNTVQTVNFNFASASGIGGFSGKDLWYLIDHGSNQSITLTSSAQSPNWDGEVSLILYEYNALSPGSLDCGDLVEYCSKTGLDDFDLESGITFNLSTSDYLLRILETTTDPSNDEINFTLTGVTSAATILTNSLCVNALDISSSSKTGNFTQTALQCDESSIMCGASSYNSLPSDNYYGASLWYQFSMPGTACSGSEPTSSTEVRSVSISVTDLETLSGSGTKNAYLELYSDCNTQIDCGKTINNSTPVTYNDLTIGATYYLKIVNNTLTSTSTSNFTINAITPGEPSPCNDYVSDAYSLSVLSEMDISALTTYSGDGASVSEGTQDDVWFIFTAPSANGDNYPTATADLSFITVYMESISGDAFTIDVWDLQNGVDGAVSKITTLDTQDRSVSSAGDYSFWQLGHLQPSETYLLQVRFHSAAKSSGNPLEKAGSNERFKLGIFGPGGDNSALCSAGEISVFPAKIKGCKGDCQAIYKFEVNSGGNYQIEATGDGVDVDLKVFIADTEDGGEQGEGRAFDYDHPCQEDRIVQAPVSSVTLGDEHSCGGGSAGWRKTYNLAGSSTSNRVYYFIEITDQSAGGAYHGCGGAPGICKLKVFAKGSTTTPFSGGCTPSATPLPVALINFSGSQVHGNNVLEWQTSSELNNSHFEIEMSTDLISFSNIGKVSGHGTTSKLSNYQYIDKLTYSESNFYRLKQVDFNGNFKYSKTIRLQNQTIDNLSIYPNPITAGDKLLIKSSFNFYSYSLIHINGSTVQKEEITSTKKYSIDTRTLKKGIYVLQLKGVEKTIYRRIIIL